MLKIVIENKIPFIQGVLEPFANVEYLSSQEITNSNIKDADALIVRTRTKCNKQLLENTAVKFIATATIGFDHIDTNYCLGNNIKWTNAPGCNSKSVEQYILLSLIHIAIKYDFDFNEKVLGIIGYGNVGTKVAKIAKTLGFKLLINDPIKEKNINDTHFVDLETIQNNADIITFHTPLNKGGEHNTLHMFNQEFLLNLKKKIILINTSRGEVVDTTILKEALKNGEVLDAIIDVWEDEPNIDKELLKNSMLTTPHIAGYSYDGKANGTSMSIQAIAEFFKISKLIEWYPNNIPQPANLELTTSHHETYIKELLSILKQIYDIEIQSNALKYNPENFEQFRNNYPIRREFHIYKFYTKNLKERTIEILNNLGLKEI
jgi:erythronate-4-phosphate dehydrogenase